MHLFPLRAKVTKVHVPFSDSIYLRILALFLVFMNNSLVSVSSRIPTPKTNTIP